MRETGKGGKPAQRFSGGDARVARDPGWAEMGLVRLDKPAWPPYKGPRRAGRARLPWSRCPSSREPPVAAHSFWFYREAGGFVRKKKPLDPVRQAQKNRAYRIGYLIALAGILCGFVLLELKPV